MRFNKAIILAIFGLFFLQASFGKTRDKKKTSPQKNEKKITKIKKVDLPIAKAIKLILKKNFTVRSFYYDILMSDTSLLNTEKKYAPILSLEGSYNHSFPPKNKKLPILSSNQKKYDTTFLIQKYFSTGTSISAGIKESIFGKTPSVSMGKLGTLPGNPVLNKPSLFVEIKQELLNNAFGINDRRTLKLQKLQSEINRDKIINSLSNLFLGALTQYWEVVVKKESLKIANRQLKSTRQVRNIIARNIRFGLSEKFDLNQWNGNLFETEGKVQLRNQEFKEAVRTLLRTVNLPRDAQIAEITHLTDVLPSLKKKKIFIDALKKRTDYKIILKEIEKSKLDREVAMNEALPSLSIFGKADSLTQEESIKDAHKKIFGFENYDLKFGLKMTYPLGDKGVKARVRNAELIYRKNKINLEDKKEKIRDEIYTKVERVQLTHQLLLKSRKALNSISIYYASLLNQSRRGRFNSVRIKAALDQLVGKEFEELNSLINYNIALLELDIAKNQIFEKYNIDVKQLIVKLEEH